MADNTGTQQLFDLWKKQVRSSVEHVRIFTNAAYLADPSVLGL